MQRLDFKVGSALAVELNATGSIKKGHPSQTRAHLRTADFAEVLIINHPPLKDEPDVRVVRKRSGSVKPFVQGSARLQPRAKGGG